MLRLMCPYAPAKKHITMSSCNAFTSLLSSIVVVVVVVLSFSILYVFVLLVLSTPVCSALVISCVGLYLRDSVFLFSSTVVVVVLVFVAVVYVFSHIVI